MQRRHHPSATVAPARECLDGFLTGTLTAQLTLEAETGSIVDVNDAAAIVLERPAEALREHTIEALAEQGGGFARAIAAARKRSEQRFTAPHTLASGAVRQLEAQQAALTIDDRAFETWIIRDITDDIAATEAFENRINSLQRLLDHMDQGLSMVDGDLRAVFTNKKFYELLDMPPALGEGDADYERFIRFNAERGEYGPGDIEDLIRERVKLAKQFEAHCFERERPDGTVIEIRGNPLPEGGFVTIYTDITERRRHDEALREAVALQRNLLDHSPAIIAIRDLEGRFQLVNRAYEQLFEVDRSEIEGKLASDVMSEEFARRLADYDRHVIQSGESLTHEHDATFVDGPGTLLSVRFPVRNAAGALTGVGSIAVDVTERRRAELALNAAKEEAELANRAKTEFLANMSHELRTPLNAIIGFSQIIEQGLHGALPDKYRSYARDILESGQHLSDLLGDILDLSKIEAAKYELQEQPIDLREAADTCLRLVDERAKAAGLTLVSRIRRNVPALYGDQTALKQVLLNLLTNAIKFTPSGGSIALRAGKSRKGGLWLSVADTGLGMAPNDIKVALTAFGQVASHLTRNHEGSGLGLPLCKSLVELHGGTLEVESALDQGTTVTVRFPPERTLTASRRRQLPKAG